MASAFSHAIAAVALSEALPRETRTGRLVALGAFCAVIPDADVVAFRFGVPYGSMLGHRGFTHSLVFAALLAAALSPVFQSARRTAAIYLFACAASHGVLDAFTNGGLGVAFFAPFSGARFFFPWRPIEVSPIGVGRFFSQRGLAVILSELKWIWAPAFAFAGLARSYPLIRRATDRVDN